MWFARGEDALVNAQKPLSLAASRATRSFREGPSSRCEESKQNIKRSCADYRRRQGLPHALAIVWHRGTAAPSRRSAVIVDLTSHTIVQRDK
jgi:hypothetical protein